MWRWGRLFNCGNQARAQCRGWLVLRGGIGEQPGYGPVFGQVVLAAQAACQVR